MSDRDQGHLLARLQSELQLDADAAVRLVQRARATDGALQVLTLNHGWMPAVAPWVAHALDLAHEPATEPETITDAEVAHAVNAAIRRAAGR